jgi:hypothetical protein
MRRTVGASERLASRDAEIAFMLVSDRSKAVDYRPQIGAARYHHIDVDDRLSWQAGDRGAPDMLDPLGERTQSDRDTGAEFSELIRPSGIVIDQRDRFCHHYILRALLNPPRFGTQPDWVVYLGARTADPGDAARRGE